MGKFIETFKIVEIKRGLVIGIIISILIICSIFKYGDFSAVWDNYGTYTSLSAAFVGFLITAFTILFAFPEEGKIKDLKNHRLYPHIFYLFIISIIAQVILFSFSLLGLLFQLESILYAIIVLITMVESIMLLVLILWILKRMLDLYFK